MKVGLEMQDHKIEIRFAQSRDSESILSWRKNKLSREMSFDSRAPTLEEHSKWFSESL